MISTIDTNFKMYSDTPDKKDPDTYSRTLRDYHLYLWSKPLPNGKIFSLTAKQIAPYYLYHSSALGDFCLSSDSITHTYSKWTRKRIANIVKAISKADIDNFFDLGSTIGGYIIFPANPINHQPTINGIRGMHAQIMDRFDFTLECIRRWYTGLENPLSAHLDRYSNYFQLFGNFQGYYRFFLFDDLVDSDSGNIRFWLPFTEFGKTDPLPADEAEYWSYMKNVSEFIKNRNSRIASVCAHCSQK